MRISGAIFDLDGTLLGSMPVWQTVGSRYLLSVGAVPEQGLDEKLRPLSLAQAGRYLTQAYRLDRTTEEVCAGVNGILRDAYVSSLPLKPGAREALLALKERGVRLCVATEADGALARAALSRCGVLTCFDALVTCSQAGAGKESPAVYEKALEAMGTRKEKTLVFEDALHAVRTARRAGFPVAAVYEETARDQWEEMKKIADYALRGLDEWRSILG